MKIATLLFTYHRSSHTKQVIDALKQSKELPHKLFVFQDGLRQNEDIVEWKKVNELINNIKWCNNEIIVAKDNKGLATSIVTGINYALEEYEAVIVLEDDCVPSANFISFMRQCFEKYYHNKKIFSVSGYAWPIILPKDSYDVYGCGRTSSWGWGTWKDRWKKFSTDNNIVKCLKKSQNKSYSLATWRNDYEQALIGNITGKIDSWGVYWGLSVIINDGICINPYVSLIQNIGMDGTGEHCGATDRFQVEISDGAKLEFKLPDDINILHTTEVAFADLYGSYTATSLEDISKKNILIYGLGNFFMQYEKEINECYNIKAFIDKRKRGWYAGKKIISLNEMKRYDYEYIIIMIQDIQECIYIEKQLIAEGINVGDIILGHKIFGKYSNEIDDIIVLNDGKLGLIFNDLLIRIRSKCEFDKVYRVFFKEKYSYFVNNEKMDIVLDANMGIGDAVLYFANQTRVKKIYGYDPEKELYLIAKENLAEYLNEGRINILQYNIDSKKILEIFGLIINEHSGNNIIMKMNCMNEEYDILEDLIQNHLLEKAKVVMLDCCPERKKNVLESLKKVDFSWWCNNENGSIEMIYAYRY